MFELRKRFKKNSSGYTLGILVSLSIMLLLVTNNSLSFRPQEVGFSTFSLFQKGITTTITFFSETITSVRELGQLKEEYEGLLQQITDFEAMRINIEDLKNENRRLRNLLELSESFDYKAIPAEVIGNDPENYFSTIIISKGRREGIRKHQPVVAIQNGTQGLVGKVLYVGPSTAAVKPIIDESLYVSARLQESRHEGLVNGSVKPDGMVVMRYVKKYAKNEIGFGDAIITSGMKSIYPKGIRIGTVQAIHAKDYENSLELEIKPVIDFSRIEYVFVLNTGE